MPREHYVLLTVDPRCYQTEHVVPCWDVTRAQTDCEGKPIGGEDAGHFLGHHGGLSHCYILRLL